MCFFVSNFSDDLIAVVEYVTPGSSADALGMKRGDLFHTVNGQKLTRHNCGDLLYTPKSSLTLTRTIISSEGQLENLDDEITVVFNAIEEPKVAVTNIFQIPGKSVGYLLFNAFSGDAADELNKSFGEFRDAGISELILDLRFNLGGKIHTSNVLASLITGLGTDQIFFKEQFPNSAYPSESDEMYISVPVNF